MTAASGGSEALRLDKWLWHARVVRTRVAAQALATSGHVRINGKRASASSQKVRPGDVLTVALERTVRVLRVRGLGERRMGAMQAAELFEEISLASGAAGTDAAPAAVNDIAPGQALR
jgi:ribosome-associated heat shock protein Hsp15